VKSGKEFQMQTPRPAKLRRLTCFGKKIAQPSRQSLSPWRRGGAWRFAEKPNQGRIDQVIMYSVSGQKSRFENHIGYQELSFSAHDGARLCARFYPRARSAGMVDGVRMSGGLSRKSPPPLLCLPGFTGNAADFHVLARYLSRHETAPRDIFCLDYRGRGKSPPATSLHAYSPQSEMRDTSDFLIAFGLGRADILATGRSAIGVMLLAAARPAAIGAVIINDMSPEARPEAVARIVGLLAAMPQPSSFDEAAAIIRNMHERRFPALDESDWRAMARSMFRRNRRGVIIPSFDPRLARSIRYLDPTRSLPRMWREFQALAGIPLLIIRGENSDMLSLETLGRMRTLHPRSKAVIVPGQGHAPLLRDHPSLATIYAFLRANDPQ
jgi:pimeloyl-ACP methyl ester carboxylesterase